MYIVGDQLCSIRRLKMSVPKVYKHAIVCGSSGAPELPGGKFDAINILGQAMTLSLSVLIGEHKNPMVPLNDANFTAHISGRTGMTRRMIVQDAGLLTNSE